MQLKEIILSWVKKHPNHTALCFPKTGKIYSYEELKEEIEGICSYLVKAGVKPGHVVVISFPEPEKLALYLLALLFMGAWPCPVDILLSKSDLQELLCFLEPSYIIVSRKNKKTEISIFEFSGYQRYQADQKGDNESIFINQNRQKQFKGEASILLPTSGTTGKPKIVQISSSSIISNAKAIGNFLDFSCKDNFLSLTPLTYCHGFYNGILMPLINGAGSTVIDKFDIFIAARLWNIISQYSITVVNIVPSMIKMILSVHYKEIGLPSVFRFFICGTAMFQEEDKRLFESKFKTSVYTQFGTTESLINTMNKTSYKPDSQGVAVGCNVLIVDHDNSPLPAGEIGEITVSGNTITQGYFKNEELTDLVIKNGFLYTGDLGYLDKDGFLYIKGRKKEMINRGGIKVFPEEIDRIFRRNDNVAEVCTVGIPDKSYGEEIYTFLVPKKDKGVSQQELYGFLKEKLPKNKIPKEIIVVDMIPKGPTGKPKLKLLKDQLMSKITS